MFSLKRIAIVGAVALFVPATAAFAQQLEAPDLARMRVKIGPLYIDPRIALTNAGVDTNVFNEADDQAPKHDFTITLSPATDLWMRFGRTWLNGVIKEDIVWYKKYSSERSANNDYKLNWLVPLTRISFTFGADAVSTRERPGFEVDARVHRTEHAINGAMEIRALSKTLFGLRADRRSTAFADEVFLGANLDNELTRTVTTEGLTIRNELTPLTNLTVELDREQDRFEFNHLRDSDSTQISAGLKFNQLALIKGGIQFGFRDFTPVSPGIPGFTGLTTTADLSYVLLGSTRLAFGATRGVQYSFDVNQPYYVQSGVTGSLAQQIFGPLDLQGRVGAARLAYRTRTDALAAVADPNRVDHTRTYGIGLGWHLGSDLRLAFNLDQNKRNSVLQNRTYHGLRFGTALTYGF